MAGCWPSSRRKRLAVVSLMSTEAVHELALEPGSVAVAVVKATTVIVEAPRPAGAAR